MSVSATIVAFFKNKYFIALIAFAFIILFFDHNNYFEQRQRSQELADLQAKKLYYQSEIEKTKKELDGLSNNPSAIEKYAREHFLMKRDNEDIFITSNSSAPAKK